MSKTLKYNDYSLTYDEYLLGYADVLGSEDNGIYLRIPGSFTDIKLKFAGESHAQINGVQRQCLSWIYDKEELDPSEMHIFFTIEKPLLGTLVYISLSSPRTGTRIRAIGFVSKPNVIVISLIVVQSNSGSEIIKLEIVNPEEIINDQSYSVWLNDTLDGGITLFYCLNENPIEVGTKVYNKDKPAVSGLALSTEITMSEYGTIVEYKPGLI